MSRAPGRSSSSAAAVRYLVRAQLLPEASVAAGHVHRQTVLHGLQEGHPALALLLEALPPQQLRLHLAAPPQERQCSRLVLSSFTLHTFCFIIAEQSEAV